jgi:serine/threonine kinase 38
MEFCQGGDLMNLLIDKDILSEEEARFYLAELILAIEAIHKLDCIHRDIKPDNILIDSTGHIKLSDFGLAKISEKIFENRQDINSNTIFHHNKNYSCVGTAYYVAPEVLNKKGYGPEIDWWSAGIIFYEMLIGYAPFCSKDTSEVCYKVLNWKKYFKFPSKVKLSPEAEDLIVKLINNPNKRLGKNGADEIKKHPFFKGLDWENIRSIKPPFIPKIKNDYDTKYFETFEEKEPFYPTPKKIKKRKDIEYLGYTYKEDNDLYNEHKKLEKSIFDNIKKIMTEDNKTSNTNYSSSGSGIIPSSNNIKANSNSISKKVKKSMYNDKILKIENNNNNNKDQKLNIIQLPRKKSNMNINKKENVDSINTINMETITSRVANPKMKINIGQVNKKNKKLNRISPKPKLDLILKILNLSKNKINNNKSKSNSRSKSKKNSNSNRSCSKNSKNTDKSFNYNCSLLKQILKKSIKNNSMNKKINDKQKNNIKIIKNIHNKSYNNTGSKILNNIHNGSNFKNSVFEQKPPKISVIYHINKY